MPSAYLTDLVDHKERVARYMYAAASILTEKVVVDNAVFLQGYEQVTNLFALFETACALREGRVVTALQGQALQILRSTAYNYLNYSQKTGAIHWYDFAIRDLFRRSSVHDNSKFADPEYALYEWAFPDLQRYAYGSTEFSAALATIQPAIDHHYQVNDHHPEHFPGGVPDMHDIQALEMCCDWLAASERSQMDIHAGMRINQQRFALDDQLTAILVNTIDVLKEQAAREQQD